MPDNKSKDIALELVKIALEKCVDFRKTDTKNQNPDELAKFVSTLYNETLKGIDNGCSELKTSKRKQ